MSISSIGEISYIYFVLVVQKKTCHSTWTSFYQYFRLFICIPLQRTGIQLVFLKKEHAYNLLSIHSFFGIVYVGSYWV